MSKTGAEQGEPQRRTLNEKIDWLAEHMWPTDQPRERAKSNRSIGEAIEEATGISFDGTTFWQLRSGRNRNPKWDKLTALSKFFHVPFGYFGDDEEAEAIGDQLSMLASMRDNGLTRVALRQIGDMSPEGRQTIVDMIDSIARREQERAKQKLKPDEP